MKAHHYLNLQRDKSASYGVTRGNHQKSRSTTYTTRFTGQVVEKLKRTRSSNTSEARYPDPTAHYGNIDDLTFGVAPMPCRERIQHVFSPAIVAPVCNASAFQVDEAMDDVFGMRFAADERYSYLFENHRKLDAKSVQNYSHTTQEGGGLGTNFHSNYALASGVTNSDTSLSGASGSRLTSSSSTTSLSHGYSDVGFIGASTAGKRQFSHGGKRNNPSRSNESLNEGKYRAKAKPVILALAPVPRFSLSSKVPSAVRIPATSSMRHSRSAPLSSISSTGPARMLACKRKTQDLTLISTKSGREDRIARLNDSLAQVE